MIRKLKVAWSFYPEDKEVLKSMLDNFFGEVKIPKINNLKAMIVPHAGYIYSGLIASYSYKALKENLQNIWKNIFILTPDHYIWMNKVLVWNYDKLETPFWELNTNKDIINDLLSRDDIFTDEFLNIEKEHALETQLPFLKYILQEKSDDFNIIPLIFWQVDVLKISSILEKYKDNSFFIISSDLSHYKNYDEAIETDKKSIEIILNKNLNKIWEIDACWIYPIATISLIAYKYNWNTKLLKYLNSWDTAWDKNHVVWYSSIIYN